MKKPSISASILGGAAIAAGFLYATNSGFNRVTNVFAAAILGVGPEADGCQRSGWWTLCLPPNGPFELPVVSKEEVAVLKNPNTKAVNGFIETISWENAALTAQIGNTQIRLAGVTAEDANKLSGADFNNFWNLVRDPDMGGGRARCLPVTDGSYQCYVGGGPAPDLDDKSRVWIRDPSQEFYDLARITIRSGIAEPAPDSSSDYQGDRSWHNRHKQYLYPSQ